MKYFNSNDTVHSSLEHENQYAQKQSCSSLSRRKLLRLGALVSAGTCAGVALSSIPNSKKNTAEAIAPALVWATLLGVSAIPIATRLWDHFVQGEVETENDSSEYQEGFVKVYVFDEYDERLNVSGIYGPYSIPPNTKVYLPYQGLVPNGQGYKLVYAESHINWTDPYRINWTY